MGKLHDKWKEYKKSHPAFDKAKKPQADLGKHLDDLEKAERAIYLKFREVSPHVSDAMTAILNIHKITKVYRGVAEKLVATDKSVLTDFDKIGVGDLSKRLDLLKDMGLAAAKWQGPP